MPDKIRCPHCGTINVEPPLPAWCQKKSCRQRVTVDDIVAESNGSAGSRVLGMVQITQTSRGVYGIYNHPDGDKEVVRWPTDGQKEKG